MRNFFHTFQGKKSWDVVFLEFVGTAQIQSFLPWAPHRTIMGTREWENVLSTEIYLLRRSRETTAESQEGVHTHRYWGPTRGRLPPVTAWWGNWMEKLPSYPQAVWSETFCYEGQRETGWLWMEWTASQRVPLTAPAMEDEEPSPLMDCPRSSILVCSTELTSSGKNITQSWRGS